MKKLGSGFFSVSMSWVDWARQSVDFSRSVAANLIDASYNALNEAITYKLFRDGAKA